MLSFGYNNRWLRLVKDILFVALGVWLVNRQWLLSVLVGILAIVWYGRDAWFQAKALWQEKHYKAPEAPSAGPTQKTDEKITVSNPSDVKEVNFEKE